jgi:hypothetical protein
MSLFFNLQNQRTGRQNSSCLGSWYQWEREGGGEREWVGEYSAILCTHVCKWKMITVETIPGKGDVGIKEKDGGR